MATSRDSFVIAGAPVEPGTALSRAIAIVGIAAGLVAILALGVLARINYDGWRKGRDKYPVVAWAVAWLAITGVVSYAVTYLIVGGKRVGDYGGLGTLVMVVGCVLGTVGTWWWDQARAEVPTLKTPRERAARAGSTSPVAIILKVVGLVLAAVGLGLGLFSFVTTLIAPDWSMRTSLGLVLGGGVLSMWGTHGFHAPVIQPPSRPDHQREDASPNVQP